jgi:hypothetical protein
MCSSFRISFNLDLCKLLPCDWMRLNAAECAAATEERLCPEAVGAGSLTTDGCDLPWLAVNLDSELTGLSGRRICMNLPLQSQTGHRRFDWGPCNEIWVSLAWYCTTFFLYVQMWLLNLLMQQIEVSGHIRNPDLFMRVVYVILCCLDFWNILKHSKHRCKWRHLATWITFPSFLMAPGLRQHQHWNIHGWHPRQGT